MATSHPSRARWLAHRLRRGLLNIDAAPMPFVPQEYIWFLPYVIAMRARRDIDFDQNLLFTTLAQPYILRSPTTSPRVQVATRIAWDSPNLALTCLPQLNEYILRPPTVSPRVQVAPRPAWDSTNLLLSLLPTTLAPFSPDDWTQRSIVTYRQTEFAPNLLGLYVPVVAPFVPADWPAVPHVNKPVADAVLNLLESTLAAAAAQAPLIADEWTAPRTNAMRSAEVTQNLLLTLLPTTAAPIASYDWTKPNVLIARPSEATQNLSLSTLTPAVTSLPFAGSSWTPFANKTAGRVSEAVQNLLLTLLPTTAAPFIPVDRTVPQQPKRRVVEALTNLFTSTLGLLPQPKPFSDYDWLVPSKPERRRVEAMDNILLTTLPLSPAAQQYVFRTPTVSPNPQNHWWRRRNHDDSTGSIYTIYVPFCNYDWLVPPLSIPTKNKNVDPNLQLSTLAPVGTFPKPFPDNEWTAHVPPTTRQRAKDAQFPNLLCSTLAPVGTFAAPFASVDWTVGPPSRQTANRAADANVLCSILASFPAPFANSEWSASSLHRPVPQVPVEVNLACSTLAPAGTFAAPIVSVDWIKPSMRRFMDNRVTDPNLQLSVLAPVGTFPEPFASVDWTTSPVSRVRIAPYADANLPLSVLLGLTGEPYRELHCAERPELFDAANRTITFKAGQRTFTIGFEK